MPKHNLLVKNLRAKWNNVNRNVVYMLYEIYYRTKRLRHNLSSQALKEYDLLTDQFVQSQFVMANLSQNRGRGMPSSNISNGPSSSSTNTSNTHKQWTTTTNKSTTTTNGSVSSPMDLINDMIANNSSSTNTKPPFEDLLNKLESERTSSLNVYCDEQSSANHSTSANFNDLLYGPNAIRTSDVVDEHVFIEFINSQIKLSLDAESAAAEAVQSSVNDVVTSSSSGKQPKSQKQQQRQTDLNKTGKIFALLKNDLNR